MLGGLRCLHSALLGDSAKVTGFERWRPVPCFKATLKAPRFGHYICDGQPQAFEPKNCTNTCLHVSSKMHQVEQAENKAFLEEFLATFCERLPSARECEDSISINQCVCVVAAMAVPTMGTVPSTCWSMIPNVLWRRRWSGHQLRLD